jgi:ring-1,2-phenylacetyl-CoA epoxidase subunit PaaE
MVLEVMVPQGHFGYQPQAGREADYLAIAAGSGITPMMAIIGATLATEANSRFTLIYGNRSSSSMMFRQALADLKDRYRSGCRWCICSARSRWTAICCRGALMAKNCARSHLLDFSRFDEAFICGPAVMMDEAETALRELGMAENRIHLERFNTPGSSVKRATGVQAEGRTVTIRQDGRDRQIALSAEDDSILDAALRQGRICPSPVKAASAPPANVKCCAAKWRWRPTTAWKRTNWLPDMC